MMIRSVCVSALVSVALNLSATLVTDSFETSHDYVADGVSGTIWDGFFYNVAGGDAVVYAADADVSNAGVLTFHSKLGNWENAANDGMLLYRTVSGDFDARVRIVSMNNVQWHDAGLMARVANLADAGAGEDWVVAKRFASGGSCGHRSTDNGASATAQVAGLQPWLRLTRSGNTITSFRSTDGENWTQIGSTARGDMNGLSRQVGIWQATFSGNEGVAQFDSFSLRTPTSWSSASSGSWSVAGNWTNGVPSGAGDRLAFPGILQNSDISVTLDGDRSAGYLSFATTNASTYSIDTGTGGALVIDDDPDVPGTFPGIEVNSGIHNITAPIVLSNGVTVTTAWNAGLKVSGGITGSGDLTKSGVGTLTITGTNAVYSGGTRVDAGTLLCLALPEGIQASYRFDNPSNLGEDSSINGNHLVTGAGAPTYSTFGRFGGALYLNGSSTLVSPAFPAGVPTGSSPYTIALWVKDDGSAANGGFLGWGSNAANQCNNLRFEGSNRIKHYWYANDWAITGLSPDPKDGNWHHIAVTWDGATQKFYLDGDFVTSVGRTGLNAQPVNFVIGKTTADVNFKGWLDNVQIANRALENDEIGILYAQTGAAENLLPVETSLSVSQGAVVDLNGTSQALAGLSGSGRLTSSSAEPVALTVDTPGGVQEFAGSIDGEIVLEKVGAGTLVLTGVSARNGGTVVSEGRLVVSMPSLQDVLEGSRLWFDAADGGTIATNGAGVVTLWQNKGSAGAALNALPVVAGAGFTVSANALNGHPVLVLNGTNGMATAANCGVYGAQNRTLFAVGSRRNSGSIYFAHTGNGFTGKAFGIGSQNDALYSYIWGGGNDITFPARANGVCEIYDYMIENGQSSATLISGETTLTGLRTVAPNTDHTPLYLGSRFGGIAWGDIAEVILFDRALTQGERAGIEAYLRAKWFTGGSDAVLSAGAVAVAEGAVLDLGGTDQTLTALSGSGTVSNGTLAVTGTIAPGGPDAVGTLRASAVAVTSGTLLTDVTQSGDADLLQVDGTFDLTGLTLQIADLGQLKAGRRYVIVRCAPGGLTGPFASTNLGGGWSVKYNNTTGEVVLVSGGLIILVQ